jgi:spore germination cell wall hydrolase CwlJ-like protein
MMSSTLTTPLEKAVCKYEQASQHETQKQNEMQTHTSHDHANYSMMNAIMHSVDKLTYHSSPCHGLACCSEHQRHSQVQ